MVVRRLHRFAGLTGLLLFMLLAVTGIALNHSDALGLAQARIESRWLLRWYGRDFAAVPRQGYAVAGHWFSAVGDRLYLDQRVLDADGGPLLGAVAAGPLRVAATPTGLWLFSDDGELVEHLSTGPVAGVRAIGLGSDGAGRSTGVVIASADGLHQTDADLVAWHAYQGAVHWSKPRDLPPPLATALGRQHFGDAPSWERVLLDLHSGRLFGVPGWLPNWLLADLAAVLMLLLSVSGLWTWLRHRRLLAHHRRRHARHQS